MKYNGIAIKGNIKDRKLKEKVKLRLSTNFDPSLKNFVVEHLTKEELVEDFRPFGLVIINITKADLQVLVKLLVDEIKERGYVLFDYDNHYFEVVR